VVVATCVAEESKSQCVKSPSLDTEHKRAMPDLAGGRDQDYILAASLMCLLLSSVVKKRLCSITRFHSHSFREFKGCGLRRTDFGR